MRPRYGRTMRALVLVDIQQDYFPGGAMPLVDPEPAAEAASSVLEAFRAAGEPVVHVQHHGAAEAGFLVKDSPGAEPHPSVAPQGEEPVVRKEAPNAFLGTDLDGTLRGIGADEVVLVGSMTSMCIDATARAAADLGYDVTVVGDACACPALEQGGRTVAAPDVQAAFLAALGQFYATVTTADELTAGSPR